MTISTDPTLFFQHLRAVQDHAEELQRLGGKGGKETRNDVKDGEVEEVIIGIEVNKFLVAWYFGDILVQN